MQTNQHKTSRTNIPNHVPNLRRRSPSEKSACYFRDTSSSPNFARWPTKCKPTNIKPLVQIFQITFPIYDGGVHLKNPLVTFVILHLLRISLVGQPNANQPT